MRGPPEPTVPADLPLSLWQKQHCHCVCVHVYLPLTISISLILTDALMSARALLAGFAGMGATAAMAVA